MDDFDEDLEGLTEFYEAPPAQRWHWSFLAIPALSFASSVAHAAGSFFHSVARDVSSHANYECERDAFAADAGRELEMILSEEQS